MMGRFVLTGSVAEDGEVVGNDFGNVAFVTVFVFPGAGLEFSFDVYLSSFAEYFSAISARVRQQTTLCHSVCSMRSPSRFFLYSVVAKGKEAFFTMLEVSSFLSTGNATTSGFFPKFPIKITLFTPIISL